MSESVDLYDTAYGNFAATVLAQIRREAFGEDIGQNSWLTADEYRRFFNLTELDPSSGVLEVACGSGGPALFMARTTGCRVLGISQTSGDYRASFLRRANRIKERNTLSDF